MCYTLAGNGSKGLSYNYYFLLLLSPTYMLYSPIGICSTLPYVYALLSPRYMLYSPLGI